LGVVVVVVGVGVVGGGVAVAAAAAAAVAAAAVAVVIYRTRLHTWSRYAAGYIVYGSTPDGDTSPANTSANACPPLCPPSIASTTVGQLYL
jgi:hypothetical protein